MPIFEEGMDALLDTFIYESQTLLESLDNILIRTEKSGLEHEDVAEIFRIMHTVKGSSAMMGVPNMSELAHKVEDLFYIIREQPQVTYDGKTLYELLFEASDALKSEMEILPDKEAKFSDFSALEEKISALLRQMKGEEKEQAETGQSEEEIFLPTDPKSVGAVRIFFDESCMMVEMRALVVVKNLKRCAQVMSTIPEDLDDEGAGDYIRQNGLVVKLVMEGSEERVAQAIADSLNVARFETVKREETKEKAKTEPRKPTEQATAAEEEKKSEIVEKNIGAQKKQSAQESIIQVRLSKLDALLDLVSEIVITQSAVSSSPDIRAAGNSLEQFHKNERQMRKLIDELQDMVMSIRTVPVSQAFSKMNRVIRDMNNKLHKNVELSFVGADTEADKSVVDILNDPLMHLVRNAVDHGIESPEERLSSGKTEPPRVTLAASDSSGEVIISVIDNGKGMDAKEILEKARKKGLLTKPESEYSEEEALSLIMKAGFSTNDAVTEYSGRGVGMDVVRSNIEKVGGKITVSSKVGEGSRFDLKIPLSLSIMEVMGIIVGESFFSIPIDSIIEVIKPKKENIVKNNDGNEYILVRGRTFPVIRLSAVYDIDSAKSELGDGVVILCHSGREGVCIFADSIDSEQSVVVKPFPPYLSRLNVTDYGMSGCSILGDGRITIILDIKTIMDKFL